MPTGAEGTRIGEHEGGFPTLAMRGMLWREWLAHGEIVLGFLAAYLVLGWVLEIFFHPGSANWLADSVVITVH